MICLISFSKLPDILPVFHFAGAIGNLYSIRYRVHVLRGIGPESLAA